MLGKRRLHCKQNDNTEAKKPMSLVQEALKRKTDDEVAAKKTPPPTPPPQSAPPPKKKKPLKGIILWILFLLLLAGMCFAIYFFIQKALNEPSAIKENPAREKQIDPMPEPTAMPSENTDIIPAEGKARKASTAYTLIKKTKDITTNKLADSYQAATIIDKEMVSAPQPTSTPQPQPTPQPTPKKQARKQPRKNIPKKVVTPVNKEPVDWPKMKLNGVMATADRSRGIAVIDDRVTPCGRSMNGVRLIAVHPDSVELEYQGEIRTLRVGGEMY